jgi:hypothetical protein
MTGKLRPALPPVEPRSCLATPDWMRAEADEARRQRALEEFTQYQARVKG